jgi:hypothetical protein
MANSLKKQADFAASAAYHFQPAQNSVKTAAQSFNDTHRNMHT